MGHPARCWLSARYPSIRVVHLPPSIRIDPSTFDNPHRSTRPTIPEISSHPIPALPSDPDPDPDPDPKCDPRLDPDLHPIDILLPILISIPGECGKLHR
jgi:hypothetical protein